MELQNLLLLTYRLKHPRAPVSELDATEMRLSSKNLGWLLRELEKDFELHPEFSALLSIYLQKRNYLMHRFFFDNASNLLSTGGCNAMVDELKGLSQVLREADAIAQEISKRLRAAAGWSEEKIEALVRAQLKRDSDHDLEVT